MKKIWSIMAKRIKNIRVTTSTRFWFAVLAFAVNMVVFCFGIFQNIDATSLGTGLALINAPLYGYIFGASARPSIPTKDEEKQNTPSQVG